MPKMVLFLLTDTIPIDDYFDILVQYQAIADLNGKNLLIVDPMLLDNLLQQYNKLMENMQKKLHIAVVIAAPEGITLKTTPEHCLGCFFR
jgi:uracil phosphoribosyltransferase